MIIQNPLGLSVVIALVLSAVAGCTAKLSQNEGAVQIAQVQKKGRKFASLFIPASDARVIQKGEAISIKLVSAYICDFREGTTSRDWFVRSNKDSKPCEGGDGDFNLFGTKEGRARTSGEIAILANAGERSNTNGLTFNPAVMQRNGRVVYYNEDVRESGQLINALNIPIYGPKTYEGGTFFLDMAIMELDNDESQQSRQLIQQLAQIGSAAFAPATPVLNVLNTLGSALLGANGDDVELRYQLEFDPNYSGFTQADPTHKRPMLVDRALLREGYYAVVRMEKRDKLPDFNRMKLRGSPYSPMLVDAGNSLYRGGTWLLVRVSREDHTQARQQDLTTKLADLLGQSSDAESAGNSQLEEVVKALQGLHEPASSKK